MKWRPSPAARFVLLFLVGLTVFGYAYSYVTVAYHEDLTWFMELTTTLSGGLASLFSSDVSWQGRYLSYRGFNLEIIDECTGLFEMVIYLVAVGAFATTWRKKLLGAALGLPIIYAFNIVRIYVLLLAGACSHELFVFLHLYLWQVILILLIAGVWLSWLYLVVFHEEKSAVAISE